MIAPPPPGTSTALYQWAVLLVPVAGFSWLSLQKYIADVKKKKDSEEVKIALHETNTQTAEKMGEIHTLVNSERGILLEMYASAMEVNAKLTNDPQALTAAKVARAMVDDHKRKQANVDSNK